MRRLLQKFMKNSLLPLKEVMVIKWKHL